MNEWLKGKVAVVTGSGAGIGRSIALDLAAKGAQVVVNNHATMGKPVGEQSAYLVATEITSTGGKAIANYDEVATMTGGHNIIKTAIDNFGRIDILVCNAGNYKSSTIEETTEEDWDSHIAVHLKGHFSCIKAAVPYMKQQKSGRIISISSRAAFGLAKSPAYSTVKAGLIGFVNSLAIELWQYGITVNCVIPSARTKLFSGEKFGWGGIPAAEPAEPAMVAPLVVYLATDEASNINGELFYVGGRDIALYSHTYKPQMVLHKADSGWTVDELVKLVPETLGVNLANLALQK